MFERLRTAYPLPILLAALLAWPSAIPWNSPAPAFTIDAIASPPGKLKTADRHPSFDWPGIQDAVDDSAGEPDDVPPALALLTSPLDLFENHAAPLLDPWPGASRVDGPAPRGRILRC